MRTIILGLLAYAAWRWLNQPARPKRQVRPANRYAPGSRAHRG